MKRIFILVGILFLSGCVSSFMEGWNSWDEDYYGGISNSNMERFKETYGSRKSSSEGRCFPGGTNEGKYIGEMFGSKPHGQGVCINVSNREGFFEYIEGDWRLGEPMGQVTMVYRKGLAVRKFTGVIDADAGWKEGEVFYSDGDRYKGELMAHEENLAYPIQHGEGRYTFSNGYFVEGTFQGSATGSEMVGEVAYYTNSSQPAIGVIEDKKFICYENCPSKTGGFLRSLAKFAITNYVIQKKQREQTQALENAYQQGRNKAKKKYVPKTP